MQNNEIAQARQEFDEDIILVGDFLTPQIINNQSSIVYPPFGQPNFQLKTNKCANTSNIKESQTTPSSYCLFQHTLRDKALEWLDSLPVGSITTWNDLAQKFYTKFFPPAKVSKLKHDISIFQQSETESFDEAWNIFKNMLRKCPHHGIGKGQQIQYFYAGLLPSFKSMIDSSSNGSLCTKTVVEALDLFERVATTTAMWPSDRVVQKKTGRST
ncbi:Uncharacterized protein Adt_04948 [Abeliophyllum distichum]|uniref:Retrotransposon gag domain-containing protein n=1 Tax=Abeliophyllum distichum TaxID=126358 RepID=A0ABD1V2Q5_9LAMI